MEFDSMLDYAKQNMAYKCGNLTDMPSRFGWIKRWQMEKRINYTNTKHPIFLYAYRAFIDALAKQDRKTLSKMCEKNLYRKLDQNFIEINKHQCKFYQVSDNIKLKMKLIDTMVVNGQVYIDRSKNLSESYYDVQQDSADKITYAKKTKSIMGKEQTIDFEQMMKERKPQGVNTGFKMDPKQTETTKEEEISIIQLDIQFASNLRLGICHQDDPSLTIGIPADYTKAHEYHVLRFERYFKLPLELRVLKDKLMKEAMNDPKKLQEMKDEEILNPWIITDLDYSLEGNPYIHKL